MRELGVETVDERGVVLVADVGHNVVRVGLDEVLIYIARVTSRDISTVSTVMGVILLSSQRNHCSLALHTAAT